MTRRGHPFLALLLATSSVYVCLILPVLHRRTAHRREPPAEDATATPRGGPTKEQNNGTSSITSALGSKPSSSWSIDGADGAELSTLTAASSLPDGPKVLYVGEFGLGHRLSKLTGAYDLARRHNLTLETHWGYCDEKGKESLLASRSIPPRRKEIFRHLFGDGPLWRWQPPTSTPQSRAADPSRTNRSTAPLLLIRNDVPGYYAGQMYKNARMPLAGGAVERWAQKLDWDLELFRQLEGRFRFADRVRNYVQQHHWDEHYVVGLHLRAGNGERDHFVQAQRGVANEHLWVQQLLSLVQRFLQRPESSATTRPAALFLATDTPLLVEVVRRELASLPLQLPLWTSPSQLPRHGVSFANRGAGCLRGWEDSWTDSVLLASTDALVAATRSTFTQIFPRASVLDRGRTYCEAEGSRMTCFRDALAWLLRNGTSSSSSFHTLALNASDHTDPVLHKVMVHLPEQFSDEEEGLPRLWKGESTTSILTYGERFASKYRNFHFLPNWTYLAA